jgi:hypothetical protein
MNIASELIDKLLRLSLFIVFQIWGDMPIQFPSEYQSIGEDFSVQISFYNMIVTSISVVIFIFSVFLQLPSISRLSNRYNFSQSGEFLIDKKRKIRQQPNELDLLKVFICYSTLDILKARNLNNALGSRSFDIWFADERLMGGQDWDIEIARAINKSDIVLVLLSKRALKRAGYMQKEIRVALDAAKEKPEGEIFIIAVRLDECEVPDNLRKLRWRNLIETNDYDKLEKDLYRIWHLRNEKLGL